MLPSAAPRVNPVSPTARGGSPASVRWGRPNVAVGYNRAMPDQPRDVPGVIAPHARGGIVGRFPIGASVGLDELEGDPHVQLARLREHEPVSWLPALDGWLVTRRDIAMDVMRDPVVFTVDDPRFSTGQVVGPSMLTLDGEEHRRHRDPFAAPFRLAAVRERFTALVEQETERLIDAIEPAGAAELRRSLAGPLAVAMSTSALGFDDADVGAVLGWYDGIVAAVTDITAGQPLSEAGRDAYLALAGAIGPALDRDPASSLVAAAAGEAGGLERERVISNAAVLLFGGIETTEGMIANAVWHLLRDPEALALVRADPGLLPNAIEESLRLEPAAAVIDRYATADVELGGAPVRRGDLVRISISAANRDPAVFEDPDRFDVHRANARLHIAFAHGPHVCIGMHLARLEAHTAVQRLLRRLPDLRLDPSAPAAPRGLVFRKPPELRVLWG
jgi:cytochrome P450